MYVMYVYITRHACIHRELACAHVCMYIRTYMLYLFSRTCTYTYTYWYVYMYGMYVYMCAELVCP